MKFPTNMLAAALVVLVCDLAPAQTNDLSLATLYPPETLRRILVARDQWRPFPTLQDRGAWGALPDHARQQLIRQGEEALAKPLRALPATLYLDYARTGNRRHFEEVFFERRSILHSLVLAECVEGKGRFLDAIANALWAICEESSWCLPAHISAQKAGVGLPDVAEPIVDLFAAETSASVAWTLYLLGAELDRVSPQLRRRADLELERRILTPVHERNFGWMALRVSRREDRPNNWTPWICASVLTAALTTEPDAERRVQLVHKLLRSLDGFLRFHPADGSCDEGPGYWGHAGGSLLDGLDLLHSATGGQLDVFSHPLIQEIGRFIVRAHICDEWFVPVGDCAARLELDRDLVWRYGQRIHDPQLRALAAFGASAEAILEPERFFGRQLSAVFDVSDILAVRPSAPPLPREVWLGNEEMQLMAARDEAGTCRGFYVAAWGGHNAQSHNHNDVGNFILFADGHPVFVDAGVGTYTAKTFSRRRYEIWFMQSAYHNLPTINGVMQRSGFRAAAREVKHRATEALAELTMDLAPAYPEEAKVRSWLRTVRLNRGRSVEIADGYELNEVTGTTTLNLLTPLEADLSQNARVVLRAPKVNPKPPGIILEFDGDKLTASVERIELDDARLNKVWGESLNRLIFSAKAPVLKETWTLRVSREP